MIFRYHEIQLLLFCVNIIVDGLIRFIFKARTNNHCIPERIASIIIKEIKIVQNAEKVVISNTI
jgi:hypothetical protein